MKRKLSKMYLARFRMEMTQQQLADKLGVTQPRISAWENLHTPIPRARRGEIARVLGLEPEELDEEARV